MADLPCDSDGVCMVCAAVAPIEVELLRCSTCATAWHSPCLSNPPALSEAADWSCPDCSGDGAARAPIPATAAVAAGGELVAAIRAIENDDSLSNEEKARRCQELHARSVPLAGVDDEDDGAGSHVFRIIGDHFSCAICMKLLDRPVTTPCGHNFCLKCILQWTQKGKGSCPKCREGITRKTAERMRINSAIVEAIREAKISYHAKSTSSAPRHYLRNDDRPDKSYRTERAKKAGKANASSGQIMVTIAPDHFGPILAEHDPKTNRGVRVGDTWEDRLHCRQWGAHFPHVAGIAGQGKYGAQSVALSGGYEDNTDHGDWFIYTGSGGRDLSQNKRTSKNQSTDQKFENQNAALRISCLRGYPVRVVRSNKGCSSYAPKSGVRYDGIYRVEKCWRKVGVQGKFKVCRYLFVRCENEPAPWTSDNNHGDRPRPLPEIEELQDAIDITVRKGRPSWDYEENEGWKWMVAPPISQNADRSEDPRTAKQVRRARKCAQTSSTRRLLKEFGCSICHKVMKEPLTTPCAHNFCKACLIGAYDCQSSRRERSRNGRTLRPQKIAKKCPSCLTDICDFLENPRVNHEMMDAIQSLQQKASEEDDSEENDAAMYYDNDDIGLNGKDQETAEDNITESPTYDSSEHANEVVKNPLKRKAESDIDTRLKG